MAETTDAQPELAVHAVIKLKRERLGISKRELGRRAGLSVAYVSALEAQHLKPSFRAFARLAAALRFTPGETYLIVQNAAREPWDE